MFASKPASAAPAPYKPSLPLLSFIVVIFFIGAAEAVLGAIVSGIVTNGGGSWWTGVVSIVVSSVIYYRGVPTKVTVALGLCSMAVALAATIVDASQYLIVKKLVTCQSDAATYGDSSIQNFMAVSSCRTEDSSFDCSCVTSKLNVCYEFDLTVDKQDCDLVLNNLPEALRRSYICCLILTVFSVLFVIFLCREIFGRKEGDEGSADWAASLTEMKSGVRAGSRTQSNPLQQQHSHQQKRPRNDI